MTATLRTLAGLVCLLLIPNLSLARYFDTPRKGTNFFNHHPTLQRFQAARQMGIRLIRLTPSKWTGNKGRFLIGNGAEYSGLVPADLAQLRRVLGQAQQQGLKVILVFLTVPGSVWRQQNGMHWDTRLYENPRYHQQLARFWRDVALALRDQPALVAYNLLNEPFPEQVWRRMRKLGRPRPAASDLNALYRRVVTAIRQVDKRRAIILDGPHTADPDGFPLLKPLRDPNVLYAFHVYEPWALTTWRKNRGRYAYPGPLGAKTQKRWDARFLAQAVAPVVAWQTRHRIPSRRIIVGEFGIDRRIVGAQRYLADLIEIFNRKRWHWLFYSFREDRWPGMDYELGRQRLSAKQWQGLENGQPVTLPRKPNRLFDVLYREFAPSWRSLIPPGRQACLLLYDLTAGRYLINSRGPACRQALAPCSTFKVVNALIGLERGVLHGPDDRFRWNGKRYRFKAWNGDQTLQSAMRYSVLWVFQQIAQRIGMPTMRHWINRLRYGNQDLSGGLTRFWLNSLMVTPQQQLTLVRDLYRDRLPFKPAVQATVRNLLVLKKGTNWVLSGKTGSGLLGKQTELGWFIGHLARDGKAVVFVLRLTGRSKTWGPLARDTLIRILRHQRLLPP